MVQTFQHESYIGPCLEGILNQHTDFPFEILLGEDGSSDGTREICQKYAARFPDKIRLFLHHPENKIKVQHMNTGNFNALYNFYSAKGKYIAFCEGDDIWVDSGKLQKQVDLLEAQPDLSLCFHSYIEVNKDLQPLPDEQVLTQPKQHLSPKELQQLNFHPLLSTLCFRNTLNGKLPEEMVQILNVDSFLISLLGNFGSGHFLSSIRPSYYRRHDSGIWSHRNKNRKLKSKILTYSKIAEFYQRNEKAELFNYFKSKVRLMQKMLFIYYLKHGRILEAIGCLYRIREHVR
ncbi:MAG: glycosyltransferase [Christiangramia sp.]|nr:glycosyltransferase [Christiangramia sp.]